MNEVLDQSQDLDGRELHRLTRNHPLPPFVKAAGASSILPSDDQSDGFAYPGKRLYSCHTSPATYVSALFFFDKRASFKPAMANVIELQLMKYAKFHGILERIEHLKKAFAEDKPTEEDKLTDDDFALLMDGGRHYPLRNGNEVKAAADFLQQNTRIIPLGYRQKMAQRIIAKADQFGASLADNEEFLQKQAGVGACSAQDTAEFLFDRAKLLKMAGKLDHAIQVASVAKAAIATKEAVHDNESRLKLAALIDRIDRDSGLLGKFPDLVPPEEVLFKITVKSASTLRKRYVNTLTGNIYEKDAFAQLKLEDVRDFMGSSFADAVSDGGLFVSSEKLAQIVPTLPLADSKLFDKLVKASGVKPYAKEAGAAEGFSTVELVAMAQHKQAVAGV